MLSVWRRNVSERELGNRLPDLISRFTLDSASEFLFGHCIDTLSAGLPYPHDATKSTNAIQGDNAAAAFAYAFSQAQQGINRRVSIGQTWPLVEILADGTAQHMKVVNAFLDPILKDALEKRRTTVEFDKTELADDQTLVDHLVNLTSDFKIIKDETFNILLAWRYTTASALTSAMYLLAMHPEFLTRLREEIISKVGLTRRPTYDDIKKMKYLRAVLNEILRLFPAVPFDVRENLHDTTGDHLFGAPYAPENTIPVWTGGSVSPSSRFSNSSRVAGRGFVVCSDSSRVTGREVVAGVLKDETIAHPPCELDRSFGPTSGCRAAGRVGEPVDELAFPVGADYYLVTVQRSS